MNTEFRDLLTDLLASVDPFKDTITHILMKRDDSGVKAMAKSRDGVIDIQAKAKHPVVDFNNVACLGSLSYLQTVLNSDYIKGAKKKFTIDLDYDTASNGETTALRNITFKGGPLESFYHATDPYINKLNNIKMARVDQWPVLFGIDATVIKHFEQLYKIHQSSPKIGGDRDDIFRLVYGENEITAIFGEKGHESHVVLTSNVQTSGSVDKLNAYFSISQFRSIIRIIGKGSGVAHMADKALKIETESKQAEYVFVIAAKKLSE